MIGKSMRKSLLNRSTIRLKFAQNFLCLSLFSFIYQTLILLIKVYRYTLSPIVGQQCRFFPTCSCYAEEAILTHGIFQGLLLTCKRIARCHPWHKGGYDPVPNKHCE